MAGYNLMSAPHYHHHQRCIFWTSEILSNITASSLSLSLYPPPVWCPPTRECCITRRIDHAMEVRDTKIAAHEINII